MQIKSFRGINNVTDPMRLGMDWLVTADNVNVTNTGALTKRGGYSLVEAGSFSSAFSTFDHGRTYLAEGGEIRTFEGVDLFTLTSSAPLYWCEVNSQVFFNNGVDSGIINPDGLVIPWAWGIPSAPTLAAGTGSLPVGDYQVRCTHVLEDGRETGAGESSEITLPNGSSLVISGLDTSKTVNVYIAPAGSTVFQLAASTSHAAVVFGGSRDTLGRDLLNFGLDPLPAGSTVIQAWAGRMYAAQYMPTEDQTVIWVSEPLGFHLFNLSAGFIMVPGKVTMLAPADSALLIGTDKMVYALSDRLNEIAPYGTLAGQHWSKDDDRILFWTTRGVCSALPFTNLTERQVSVAPGVRAGGCLVLDGGQKRYLTVIQQGGAAFNNYP